MTIDMKERAQERYMHRKCVHNHQESIAVCQKCIIQFDTFKDLEAHLRKDHVMDMRNEMQPLFVCDMCDLVIEDDKMKSAISWELSIPLR